MDTDEHEWQKCPKQKFANFSCKEPYQENLPQSKKMEVLVAIWFVVNNRNSKDRVGDIIFTTGSRSVKAKNIYRDKRASICVEDQVSHSSFVTIFATAKISP
jgi:general stress protein 26